MPGKVIGTALNYGYPGTVSKNGDEVSVSRPVKSDSANIYFGDPAVVNTDGSISRFGAANVGADLAGIAIRRVKTALTYLTQQNAYYAPNEVADLLERGPISVNVTEGTPTIGGKVYICTVAGTIAKVGDILATGTPAGAGATAVEITNARFSTGKDANSVAEITIITRQGV